MGSKAKDEGAPHGTERRRLATKQSDAVFAAMAKRASENFFANRGFSAETIEALVAHGMSIPEELLLITADDAVGIPGLGISGKAEVQAYRKRFLREPK